MINVELAPLSLGLAAPSEEELKAGADPVIKLVIGYGTRLPTPQGDAPIPLGFLSFGMTKIDAEKISEQLAQAAENLPKPSDIVVPGSNLEDIQRQAEAAIKVEKGLKGS